MIYIKEYDDLMQKKWEDLVVSYFINDLEEEVSETTIKDKICSFILDQWRRGILSISIILEDEELIGFGIYQIDTPRSDWCKREGWGFIREFFVDSTRRHCGFGKSLLRFIEDSLYAKGVKDVYAMTAGAVKFWKACGYTECESTNNDGMYTVIKCLEPVH